MFPNRYEVEINRRTAAENEFVVLKKVRVGRGWGRKEVRAFPTTCHSDVHRARAGTLGAAHFLGTLNFSAPSAKGRPWGLAASGTCKLSTQLISRVACCISAVAILLTRVSFCLGTRPFLKHEVEGMKS